MKESEKMEKHIDEKKKELALRFAIDVMNENFAEYENTLMRDEEVVINYGEAINILNEIKGKNSIRMVTTIIESRT